MSSAVGSSSSSVLPASPTSKPLIADVVKSGESERRKHARVEPDLPVSSPLLAIVKSVNNWLIRSLVSEVKTGGRVDSISINMRKSANTLMVVKETLSSFKKEELQAVFVLNSSNSLTKLENGSLIVGERAGVILEWSVSQYISLLIGDYYTSVHQHLAHEVVDHQAKIKMTSHDLAWY